MGFPSLYSLSGVIIGAGGLRGRGGRFEGVHMRMCLLTKHVEA